LWFTLLISNIFIHAHRGRREGGLSPSLGFRKKLLVSDFWKIDKKFSLKCLGKHSFRHKFQKNFGEDAHGKEKEDIYPSLSIFK